MSIPEDLKYTQTHEWIRVEGATGTMGLSDFAQHELGDLVFVDTPAPGAVLTAGTTMGSVESVKAVSDVYAAASGTVAEANEELKDHPELVNQDPYGAGWLVKVALSDPSELDNLMDADAYAKYIAEKHE